MMGEIEARMAAEGWAYAFLFRLRPLR